MNREDMKPVFRAVSAVRQMSSRFATALLGASLLFAAGSAAAENVPPEVEPLSVSTNEDLPSQFALVATDPDGDSLFYSITQLPAYGTLFQTVSGVGLSTITEPVILDGTTLYFTPFANYNGADSFTFEVTDDINPPVSVVAPITVSALNDAPSASLVSTTTLPNTPVAISAYAEDVDLEEAGSTVAGEEFQRALVTISVDQGSLDVTLADGIATSTVSAGRFGLVSASSVQFIAGSEGLISALSSVVYNPPVDFAGSANLQLVVSDQGNSGDGGVQVTTATATVLVAPEMDLAVSILPPSSVVTGQPASFQISCNNAGANNALAHTILLSLQDVSGTVIPQQFDVPELLPGDTYTNTFTVTFNAAGTAQVKAAIQTSQPDTDLSNNVATVSVNVAASANLGVLQYADPVTPANGATQQYTFVVSNGGPDAATSVTVLVTLDGTTSIVGMTGPEGADIQTSGSTITFVIPTLASGQSTTVSVSGVITAAAPTQVSAGASVFSNEQDPNAINDSSFELYDVAPASSPTRTDNLDNASVGTPDWLTLGSGDGLSTLSAQSGEFVASLGAGSTPRLSGFIAAAPQRLKFADIPSDSVVRAKFAIYSKDTVGGTTAVPALRLRLSERFAVSSIFESVNHDNNDPAIEAFAQEVRPSTDPTKPSLYRVDLVPAVVPYLNDNLDSEGVSYGFEAITFNPQDNGSVVLTEVGLSTYPRSAFGGSTVRTFTPTSSADVSTSNALNFALTNGPDGPVYSISNDPTNELATVSVDPNGLTLDTTAVAADRVGFASAELAGLYPRFSPGKQYVVRMRLSSLQPTSVQTGIRMYARTLKFAWISRLELGGAWTTGNDSAAGTAAIAQQTLPGSGTQNPNTDVDNRTTYEFVLHSPLSSDIRPEFPVGTPVDVRMPNITSQPGPESVGSRAPQATTTSFRDIKPGIDMIDTLSQGPLASSEAGNVTLDQVEIVESPLIAD